MHSFFEPWSFGDLTVDPFKLWWKGKLVDLPPVRREIVLHLVKVRGRALSWREIAALIGHDDFDHRIYGTVRSYVSRTRARFIAVDSDFTQLETVEHVGFRWKV